MSVALQQGFAAALLANGSLLVRGKNGAPRPGTLEPLRLPTFCLRLCLFAEAGQCATGFGGDACEPVRSFQPVQVCMRSLARELLFTDFTCRPFN